MIVLNELQLNGWYLLTHDLSHESWHRSAWNIPHQTCPRRYFLKCPKYIGFKYLTLNPNKLVCVL